MNAGIVTGAEAAADPDLGPERLGGKAANLARLVRLGLPVPPWLVLTSDVLAEVRAGAGPELAAALEGLVPTERASAEAAHARVRALLLARGLPAAAREALRARVAALFPPGARLAVRSSAVGEDGAKDSFAGQLDTSLHVTPAEVEEQVLLCLASAWSPRALLYRHTRGLADGDVQVAVVVQLMVDSRAAGVLFTADPTSGRRDVAVVSAGLGLGEGVVSDRVAADTFWRDLASGAGLRAELAEKEERVVLDRAQGRGTVVEPVPPELRAAPAVDEPTLVRLVELGRDLAARLGAPQDVEWALDQEGALHLLQTRPITTLQPVPAGGSPAGGASAGRALGPDGRGGKERIFDNANVVEGYPGVTTPLTFSFARTVYEATFRDAAGWFGIPPAALRERDLWPHLIAYVDGRIYYDLLNWYRVYALVPGFEERVRAWEKALGLPPRAEATRRRGGALVLRARVLMRLVGLWRSLDREVLAFQGRFQAVQARARAQDLDALSADDLLACYEQLLSEVLDHAAVTLVNDFFTFQLFDGLGKLLVRWGVDDGGGLINDLLGGERGVESVEPARSLLRLAALVRETPALAGLFASQPDDRALWARLRSDPAAGAFRTALDEHVARYGDRTVQELKLETPGLADDPALAIGLVRGALAGPADRVEALEAREAGVRAAAEARLRKALAGRPLRRWVAGWLLERTRTTVKHRENLRLLRTRAYGLVKRIFRRLGARLHESGLLAAPEDVFLLGVEEVAGAVRGTALTRDLIALTGLRRREQALYRARDPAERITLRGIAWAAPFPQGAPPADPTLAADGLLRGTGCAPGQVRAPARVVLDPTGAPPPAGQVLVARATDPGWVFLMVQAAGLVVERGSPLSHTAIVGRELGIPTVVGVAGATRLIPDGALLELDGAAGTVRIAGPSPQDPSPHRAMTWA